jgi:hypothetical protein
MSLRKNVSDRKKALKEAMDAMNETPAPPAALAPPAPKFDRAQANKAAAAQVAARQKHANKKSGRATRSL